jgi:type VI protein secretion system component VasF
MTPEFARLVDPIFQAVLDVVGRLERGADVDLLGEKSEIQHRLEAAEKSTAEPSSRVSRESFELAKRGLVYWIDEVLTDAATAWKDISLEFDDYGEKNRAFKFYVEGELKARHAVADVVEVWYLCLALGFKGDIRDAFRNHLNRDLPGGSADAAEARRAWARELARRIRPDQPRDLEGQPLEGGVAPLKGGSWLAVAVVCVLVVAAALGALSWRADSGENRSAGPASRSATR